MKKLTNITTIWAKLLAIFSKKQKFKYYRMVGLGVLNALLEVLGISLLLHTVLSILRPDFIEHNVFTSYLSDLIGVTDQLQFVAIISGLLLLAYIIKNVLIVQINKAQVKFAYDITDKVSEKRYREIAEEDLLYFKKRKTSDIINELFGCALYLPETVIIPSIMLLSEIFILVLMLSGIFIYKPFLFLFTFITVLPTAGILIYYNRSRLAKKGKFVHQINPIIYENIEQLAHGISNIKLWNAESVFKKEFNRKKRESFKYKRSIYVSSQFVPMRIYEVVAISGILCVVLFAMYNNKGSDNLINYVSIYAGVSFRLLPGVNRILGAFNSLATNNYVLEYFDNYGALSTSKKTATKDLERVTFNQSIDLKNVAFGYTSDAQVLKGVDLTINKGEYIGIVGLSGSGKSTLVNIIASLIQPDSGSLEIDGQSIDEEKVGGYRYLFSYVKQDVFMLNTTILDNITFLKDPKEVDHNKLDNCLKQVNLEEWVNSLKNGVETQVGELGTNISGGQRQRIAIARALYKEAEVFIFDEVTNNLDSESTKQTLEAIETLKKAGKTAIFISHNKAEMDLCDTKYKLENGSLHEIS